MRDLNFAFPQRQSSASGRMDVYPGLTKREYFAAKVLNGFISGVALDLNEILDPDSFDFKSLAKMAYKAADAMLQAGAQDE